MSLSFRAGAAAADPDPGVRSARWPLILPVVLLWISIAGLLVLSLQRTGGRLIYALDDPYIHMAMARNLAGHGVWGVTSEGFTSSSSSLLWTGTLALLFRVFGARDLIPFVVNVLVSTLTVIAAHTLVRRRFADIPPAALCLTLLVFTFATPLPTLVFAGQEHLLHVLITWVFMVAAADLVAGPPVAQRSREFVKVAALALVLPLVRYEGLYPVIVVASLLAIRRRFAQAVTLGLAAGAPLAAYGAVSVRNGWWLAPNSVLLKGNVPDPGTAEGMLNLLGYSGYLSLLTLPAVSCLVYAGIALWAWRVNTGIWKPVPVMLAIFVPVALLHLQYSQPRAFWLFRYEAYVIGAGIIVVFVALLDGIRISPILRTTGWPRVGAMLVLLVISPLSDRAVKSAVRVPAATANIYEQQYQMGRFLREYYAGTAVALNDIGAVSYLSDVQVVDLVGLASMDVARLRRAGKFSPIALESLAHDHDVRVAIVYDGWFRGTLPQTWLRAGSWTIENPVVVGGETVTFYATRRDEYNPLVARLREFAPRLPPGVRSTIGH